MGVEIGGTKLQWMLCDPHTGEVLERRHAAVPNGANADAILELLEGHLVEAAGAWKPVAAGIGFGGPVNVLTGRTACSHQVQGWSDFPLAKWAAPLLGRIPILVENDTKCAGTSEALFGAGAGQETVFYFNLGSGIGGALVQQGRLYRGRIPASVEFGHLRLSAGPNAPTLESQCSGWAMDARVRATVEACPDSLLASHQSRLHGPASQALRPAAAEGCPAALELLNQFAEPLALALSHVIHLFNPSVLVLGGGLSAVGSPLVEAVERALPSLVMEAMHPVPSLKLASRGGDVVPLGAAWLASQHPKLS